MPKTIVHPKKRGEWVELQFVARAAHHGLTVSKPWGDTARYDFIVEHGGRFQRVQVKSTTSCPPVRKGRIPGSLPLQHRLPPSHSHQCRTHVPCDRDRLLRLLHHP